jgi:hypothetical protein
MLGNQETARMYIPSYLYYLSGSKPRTHSFEALWWNSRSRFKHCEVHTAIRSPKFNQKGTIVLRPVDRDPVLTVGAERRLIRKDGVAALSAWRCRREIHSCTPYAKLL